MSKLYVGNLPADVNEASLRQLFQDHSLACTTILVKRGGYAFVDCPDQSAADRAIDKLNDGGARQHVTRRQLFDALNSNIVTKETLYDYVQTELGLRGCSEEVLKCLKKDIVHFKCDFDKRWKNCSRVKHTFLVKYSDWLDKEITFSKSVLDTFRTDKTGASTSGIGRPKQLFDDSSNRTKSRKIKPLVSDYTKQEIVHAAQVTLRKSGKRDAAELLKEIQKSPTRATKIKKAIRSPSAAPIPFKDEEALSFLINNDRTKKIIQMGMEFKQKNANILPSYQIIKQTKSQYYPPKEDITITDTSVTMKLLSFVDHTIKRLVQVQEDVLLRTISGNESVHVTFKWGCDGSSGQSQYKQKFTTQSEESVQCDSDLFAVSLVPLQMYSVCPEVKEHRTALWQNPRPSSTRFCRPIKLLFGKETVELTKREVKSIEDQIKLLEPTKVTINDKEIHIKQDMMFTMVDGKICNSLTGTSAQKCYICHASPKEMNNTALSRTILVEENYSFGLSTLHCWIRFFECLLHIAYRLDIKKWQVRNTQERNIMAERKKSILQRFRIEMGLLVDQPRSGGSGTSNDGNTARRFFLDPALSSNITGINEELIRRFSVILRTISCPYPINITAFEKYAQETTDLYLRLYTWYYMPVTVHKVLIHGAKIIESCIVPIGQLSEEAQECRNKDFRRYREAHARKFSRISNLQDVVHLLLVSSDPVISHKNTFSHRLEEKLPTEVLKLLEEPNVPRSHMHAASNADDTSSDDSSETPL